MSCFYDLFCAGIAAGLLLTGGPVLGQSNLIPNAGFEQLDSAGNPTNWGNWQQNPGTVSVAIDQGIVHSGRAALKVVSSGDGNWSVASSPNIAVHPGDVYRFGAWFRREGQGNADISLHTCDSSGNTVNWVAAEGTLDSNGSWRCFAHSFTIPRGVATIQFRMTGFGAGPTWLDDVSLVRLGSIYDSAPQRNDAGGFDVPAAGIAVDRDEQGVTVTTDNLRLYCDLTTGLWNVRWRTGSSLTGLACDTSLSTGVSLNSRYYGVHACAKADVSGISNGFGKGMQIVVHHRTAGKPELRQIFAVYPGKPFLLARLQVVGPTSVSTNDIAPLVCDDTIIAHAGAHLDAGNWLRTLYIQEDDAWWHPCNSDTPNYGEEMTAIFDNTTRHAIVLGSVTHDQWRTGIDMDDPSLGSIGKLRIFGGADATEHPQADGSHGYVSGTTVSSPEIFLGQYADWRDGLEAYGRANAVLQPPVPWNEGVPFGWNSWSVYDNSTLSSAGYMAASEALSKSLAPAGFGNNGVDYVNLDGGWTNLSHDERVNDVKAIHARGQKAGVLLVPFATWSLDGDESGTDGKYTWKQAVLRDSQGNPVFYAGAYAVDPTFPGTQLLVDNAIRADVDEGFDYIGIDWIQHAALEGRHYDPKITTGIAAYNAALRHVMEDLDPKKTGRSIFVDLMSSLRFPSGYAQARTVTSDANFGTLESTMNVLNGLTYTWWQAGSIYRYSAADSINVYQCRGQKVLSVGEGRSRLNADVIAGSIIIDGDNYTDPNAMSRAMYLLTNREVMALAATGRPFRPVEGDTDTDPADTFTRNDGARFYVAVFNFDDNNPVDKTINLDRLGLDGSSSYVAHDLWSGATRQVQGSMAVHLGPADSTILCLSRG